MEARTPSLKSPFPRLPGYTRRSLAVAALAAIGLASLRPVGAQTANVEFTAQVPPAPAEMQLYRLAPTAAPVDFLNEKLTALKLAPLKLESKTYVTRGATGATDADKVRAFVEPTSGDMHFIPNLAELSRPSTQAAELPAERARSAATAIFADARFIPKDGTELHVVDPIAVMGGTLERGAGPAAPQGRTVAARVVLTLVPAVRYASGLRVYGRGSHALASVGNDGSLVGALRRWRTASAGDKVRPTATAEQVRAEITRQLHPFIGTHGARATVDKIALAYYDGNASYLQPVYRFEATISTEAKQIAPIKVAGYVPVAKTLEPIPDLAAAPQREKPSAPKRPPTTGPQPRDKSMGGGIPGDISLGEYVNQDWPNNGAYVDMSNSFLAGLTFLDSFIPGLTPPTVRTQWYVAYPWEVVGSDSKYFLNAVNVAYTVPHGNWLINTTLSNCCDTWYVPDIGTGGNPGFGSAAGGVLATWIIMSCEVIPSVYDRANQASGPHDGSLAFTAWWPVFQGLHNAIGFRTEMFYPDDALQFGFGYDASLGGDINAAWFQEVAAVDGDDGTYNDGNLTGNPSVHYDRASTMIDARNLGQSIYNVSPQSASTTLWNFWMNN
jgi:hypothetical protein